MNDEFVVFHGITSYEFYVTLQVINMLQNMLHIMRIINLRIFYK